MSTNRDCKAPLSSLLSTLHMCNFLYPLSFLPTSPPCLLLTCPLSHPSLRFLLSSFLSRSHLPFYLPSYLLHQMALLEDSMVSMRMQFNERFLALRDLKRQIVLTVRRDNSRIREIDIEVCHDAPPHFLTVLLSIGLGLLPCMAVLF
jgi:hypothetical protein